MFRFKVAVCLRWPLLSLTLLMFALPGRAQPFDSVTGMPPNLNPLNIYEQASANKVSPALANHLPRVYVPNRADNTVSVIDPAKMVEVARFAVGISPQHVVPAWDMSVLWVNNNGLKRKRGSLTPIDPFTAKPMAAIAVDDPYNMYFSPNGRFAIIVAEAERRLDFRDPRTMALQFSIEVPRCAGINHGDFSLDGSFAIFTCEFSGRLARINMRSHTVDAYLTIGQNSMPQDVRASPDGQHFFIADMRRDGVHVLDAKTFKIETFIPTAAGAHGLYLSRDSSRLFVANRGTGHSARRSAPDGPGGVSVIDIATKKMVANWLVPGGGSPDMGNLSADGRQLWLSGRFDSEVYVFDTETGAVKKIPVGKEPHGLTVWPQPGRYSLGHTGITR